MHAATTVTPTATTPDLAARRAYLVDAAGSLPFGLSLAIGAGVLSDPLGIPSGWLLGLGAFAAVYALDLLLLVRALPGSRTLLRPIALGNAGWVMGSLGVVIFGWFPLTTLGAAVVLAQAVLVAGFVVLQLRAADSAST